jgi:tetraacyldisaccharide 4'-kinase
MLSKLYARVAARRRRWYEQHQDSRRRLVRPVISVGGISVGGSGKTPVAKFIAELLRDAGEYPAILSRGYGRAERTEGVVVVRDRNRVLADFDVAGDEPRMLAEQLSDVCVLVGEDRYIAGHLAETQFGATVHVLDDGFQHYALERDIDLLLLHQDDCAQRTLPSGRLRESIETARCADVVIVDAVDIATADTIRERLQLEIVFRMERLLGNPLMIQGSSDSTLIEEGARILVVSGIAKPIQFTDALLGAGFNIVDTMFFKDHHRFTAADIRHIAKRNQSKSIDCVVTTEKDAVRFMPHAPLPFSLAVVPLAVQIQPANEFRSWLLNRLQTSGLEK